MARYKVYVNLNVQLVRKEGEKSIYKLANIKERKTRGP